MGPAEHLGTDCTQVSKLTGLPLLMVSPWGAWRPRPHFLLLDFPKKHCSSALGGATIPGGLQVQPNARTALSFSNKPFTAFDTIQVSSSHESFPAYQENF